MSKNLQSLKEFNTNKSIEYTEGSIYPRFNGLACPDCGAELQDTDSFVLESYPPQKNVNCSKCKFTGYRVY